MTKLLEQLIPQYAQNKSELESYKKICDKENLEIKEAMRKQNVTEYKAGNYIAKCTVSERQTVNEEKLLELLKSEGLSEVIKTKEYVDMDALEKAIYNNKVSDEILIKMDTCRDIKLVTNLKVSMIKNKKEDKNNE